MSRASATARRPWSITTRSSSRPRSKRGSRPIRCAIPPDTSWRSMPVPANRSGRFTPSPRMESSARKRGRRSRTRIPATPACGRRSRSILSWGVPICRWKRPPTTIMAVIAWAAICSPIVCVDLETGKRIWHYQITHHDIWNYDLPSSPALVNMTIDGKPVKALVQLTKQGYAYVLDRVTGKPVWPIEERAVPASDVPGERAWATQPHPTKPAAYEPQGYVENDLIDFTPELRAEAARIARQYRLGPLFTPPSEIKEGGTKGTWYNPGGTGGSLWQSGGFDPETNYFYIPSKTGPGIITVRHDPKSDLRFSCGPGGADLSVQALPRLKPPYSRITALNLNTGEFAWVVPLGTTPARIAQNPALKGINLPNTGG